MRPIKNELLEMSAESDASDLIRAGPSITSRQQLEDRHRLTQGGSPEDRRLQRAENRVSSRHVHAVYVCTDGPRVRLSIMDPFHSHMVKCGVFHWPSASHLETSGGLD